MGAGGGVEEGEGDAGGRGGVGSDARGLASRGAAAGDPYVAGQARSVAVQLEVREGRVLPYDEMVAALLGVSLAPVDQTEMARLRDEVLELAGGDLHGWESSRLVTGEAKWDAALQTYIAGRRYAFSDFALPVEEDLELVRITDELWSVNLN